MSEVPICQARASVMIYDDANKKWMPSGSSQGMSKVQIYQHTVNNTYRVVGRKLQDHEFGDSDPNHCPCIVTHGRHAHVQVVINCAVLKNLKYNQATPTFHQWRDSRHVYGLNFANKEDSEAFANAMLTSLETLNSQGRPPGPPNPPAMAPPHNPPVSYMQQQQQQYQAPQPNGPQFNDAIDNRTSRPDPRTHQRHPSGGAPVPYQQQTPQPVSQPPAAPPVAPPAAPPAPPAAPPAPPVPPAGPPAPPAPSTIPAAPPAPPAPAAPPAPPAPPGAPPAPPAMGGAPPPPPPPPPGGFGGDSVGGGGGGGLAAALQAAQLKKMKKVEPAAESKPPPSGGGGGSHMDELQKMLLKRTQKAQNTDAEPPRNVSPSPAPAAPTSTIGGSKPWEKPATNGNKLQNGTGSPKFPRKRNPSLTGQENIASSSGGGGGGASSSDLENLKQEILTEMRKEINKMKQEILEAIRDSGR